MARLRSPTGCPWDREQTHMTLRRHAIEEVYELIDAIEARDDHEMAEELGDLLLQVVFHCQLARERGAFDFEKVCRADRGETGPPPSARFRHDKSQGRGRGLGELGKNQARREARDATRAPFRVRRHSETSARVAPRRKTGEEGAQGLCGWPPGGRPCFKAANSRNPRWRRKFLNWRRPPSRAAGARRNCCPPKRRSANAGFAAGKSSRDFPPSASSTNIT